jgi:hypothetical protein
MIDTLVAVRDRIAEAGGRSRFILESNQFVLRTGRRSSPDHCSPKPSPHERRSRRRST